MNLLLKLIRPAVTLLFAMILICGAVYTGLLTAIAQLAFPYKANGSIISVTLKDGTKRRYGSQFIAQEFLKPEYLIGRPMLVSNLSPVCAEQADLVMKRINRWHNLDPGNRAGIPADLITASGSGVDPYISPEGAEYQVARIAKERGLTGAEVRGIIKKYTVRRFAGFIGEEGVNVLEVNLALDGLR